MELESIKNDDSYIRRRELILRYKFEQYSDIVGETLVKEEAAASMTRAMKAENLEKVRRTKEASDERHASAAERARRSNTRRGNRTSFSNTSWGHPPNELIATSRERFIQSE